MTAIPKNLKELSELDQKLKWEKTKWENIFFPVYEEENIIQNTKTGKKTLYRNDRGRIEIISTVGTDYSTTKNEWLHTAIQNFSRQLQLNLKFSNCIKNRKSILVYDIKNKKEKDVNINKDDDGNYFIKLLVKNSYDGTHAIEFEIAIVREVCSNGMTIPASETYKLRKKHIGIDYDHFEQNVHEFLMKILSKENFQKIIDKINMMKNETPTMKISVLKSLPIKQLLPILEGIKKYSTEPVIVSYYNYKYDLTKSFDNDTVKNMILEKKNKTERSQKRIETEEIKSEYLEYDEKIINQWTLIQFIIKLVSFKIHQNRRFEVVKRLMNNF